VVERKISKPVPADNPRQMNIAGRKMVLTEAIAPTGITVPVTTLLEADCRLTLAIKAYLVGLAGQTRLGIAGGVEPGGVRIDQEFCPAGVRGR